MKKPILIALLSLLPAAAAAATPTASSGASQWHGSGTAYDRDRNIVDTYSLDISVQPGAAPSTQRSVVTMVPVGGKAVVQTCDQQNGAQRWTQTCDDGGSGAGYFFDNNLGTDYYRAADGKSYSTTIVVDGAEALRFERVELDQHGEALRFYSETVTKVAN